MARPSTRARLLARLRAMGLDLPEGTALLRTHAQRADRAAGAWSWYALGPGGYEVGLGSQHPMRELLAAVRLVAGRSGTAAARGERDVSVYPTLDLDSPAAGWVPDRVGYVLYEPVAVLPTPVEITARYPRPGGGRVEAWAARSRDGVWTYGREELPGTPWIVQHLPTGRDVPVWFATLEAARWATADGSALAALAEPEDTGAQAL